MTEGPFWDPDYRELTLRRLRSGRAPQLEIALYHYAYGKPKDPVEQAPDVRTVVVHKIYKD